MTGLKISVAISTFNGRKYLPEQLESILSQTARVDEIVICDDGSSDGTYEYLNNYSAEHPYFCWKILQNEKRLGTKGSIEKALKNVTGDIIFLADQDDVWLNSKVETLLDAFRKKPNAKLFFTNASLISENSQPLRGTLWSQWNFNLINRFRWRRQSAIFSDLFQNKNYVTGATLAFKKELLKTCLPFNLPMGYWHDAWLALNAAAASGCYFINKPLIKYRIHDKQQIGLGDSMKTFEYAGISMPEFQQKVNSRLKRSKQVGTQFFTQVFCPFF